ncbi:PREDICTED: uncharacterized protein LOC108538288 [Rhinopithecus bieti]|uniref:uncharacterized protein LOC108538288 n=1 Tax=Rhinopithecus bieti TaxID=61621 RepID=UPI00083BF53B|nr:PREDICTED: uncharacterized protein LOC108538288 [Rhinopithecus bieti]
MTGGPCATKSHTHTEKRQPGTSVIGHLDSSGHRLLGQRLWSRRHDSIASLLGPSSDSDCQVIPTHTTWIPSIGNNCPGAHVLSPQGAMVRNRSKGRQDASSTHSTLVKMQQQLTLCKIQRPSRNPRPKLQAACISVDLPLGPPSSSSSQSTTPVLPISTPDFCSREAQGRLACACPYHKN